FSGTELSPPQARRQLHRLDDLRISGAAAQIARKIMADFLLIGVWILRQQLLGHQNKTGCAKPALKGAAVDERLLHRRQRAAGIQVFNRGDGLSVRSNCEIEATRHRHAIDQNRATTAQTLTAAFARTGKAKLMQQLDQIAVRVYRGAHRTVIQHEANVVGWRHSSSPSGRPSAALMARSSASGLIGRSIRRMPTASWIA